jgi:hypothetical protein
VRGNEIFAKKHVKPINLSFIVLDSKVKPLEFLSTSLLVTPHQIGIG